MRNWQSSLIQQTKNWPHSRKSENGNFSKLIINYMIKTYKHIND